MSNQMVVRISSEDLNKIQNGIEQCLVLHLTLNETKNTLLVKAGIRPEVTEFAWQKLEQVNPEFFKAYNFRLLLKDQIETFNRLLERQAELMAQMTNTPAIHMPQRNMLMAGSSNMGLVQTMTGETVNPGNIGLVQAMNGDMINLGNTGFVQTMNGEMANSGTGHINGSHFMFGLNGDVLDAHHAAVAMSGSPYSSIESQSQPINNTLLGVNAAFENMRLIPRSFSHPDLTPNFSISSGGSNMGLMQAMNGEMNPGNMGLVQAMSREMMNSGTGHINGSHFTFGPNGDVLDARRAAVEMPVSSYSIESQSRPINNTLLGVSGQIPSSFSQPDLTAIFSLNSDLLETYPGSPFLASGSNILNPQDRIEQQDNRRLDTNGRFE